MLRRACPLADQMGRTPAPRPVAEAPSATRSYVGWYYAELRAQIPESQPAWRRQIDGVAVLARPAGAATAGSGAIPRQSIKPARPYRCNLPSVSSRSWRSWRCRCSRSRSSSSSARCSASGRSSPSCSSPRSPAYSSYAPRGWRPCDACPTRSPTTGRPTPSWPTAHCSCSPGCCSCCPGR